jgi:hypothetical protein
MTPGKAGSRIKMTSTNTHTTPTASSPETPLLVQSRLEKRRLFGDNTIVHALVVIDSNSGKSVSRW